MWEGLLGEREAGAGSFLVVTAPGEGLATQVVLG